MNRRSPTIEGFRLMFSRPALGLAEIAWRWSFGGLAILSGMFLVLEYLRTLPVTPADIFLLRTRHPLFIAQALANIFQGSATRLGRASLLLFALLSLAWILLGSWARLAIVKTLLSYFSEDVRDPASRTGFTHHRAPVGINLLRVIVTVCVMCALAGTFILAGAASPPTDPSAGRFALVFLSLAMGILAAWWLLNWLLSFAAIFVVADGSGSFTALTKAVDLCRARWGAVMAAGTWFGIAHTVAFFIATSVVAFPLAFVGVLPGGVVLGGVLLVALLYFAAADYLYAGKMAAYVAIAKWPQEIAPEPIIVIPQSSIDRGEPILSDSALNP